MQHSNQIKYHCNRSLLVGVFACSGVTQKHAKTPPAAETHNTTPQQRKNKYTPIKETGVGKKPQTQK
jgi:hypothetical protein